MLKKSCLLIASILLISMSSCDKSDVSNEDNEICENKESQSLSKREQLPDVSVEYSIPQDIYNQFLDSLIFDSKDKLRGAYIGGIEIFVDESEKVDFWSNFGIDTNPNSGDTEIWMRHKPKGTGCKKRKNWICFKTT